MTAARLAQPIVLAWGLRRALIAFLAGGASTLAMAPIGLWPVMAVTFPIIVWLIDGAVGERWSAIRSAAAAGWWFGFGYFLSGLYWVGFAFLVDAKTFGWLMPFAVLALPAGLALFTAFGFGLARALWTRGVFRILILAAALTLAEWLRGHLLTGFPWNAFGYALTTPLALAQGAALIGLWGLTFVAVAVFASPAMLADEPDVTRRPWLAPAVGAFVLLAFAGYGAVRLARTPTNMVDGVRLRIMQPNLSQDAKFNYAARTDVMRRYLALSERATGPQSAGLKDVTHLIWPESAFPFFLTREPEALSAIADMLPPGTVLITGAARIADGSATTADTLRAYNSVYVIDHDGTIGAVYDKVHLVPFGEYLPFQELLERIGLQQLTKVRGGFTAGERRRALPVPGAPAMLPLICYEIIFPGEAVPRGERPGWLVNLTNDGWFGLSPGPYQHLHQAQVRAIEEGLPVVRAANTGISAVIDPVGRIVRSLPLGVEAVLDSPLPKPVSATPYTRLRDSVAWIAVVATLLIAAVRVRRA